MGNDGGSIPDRRDLVKSKPKAEQADKANQTRAKWFFCALSKRKLQEPIVSCELGKLYNKDAIIEYMIDKSLFGDGERICGHIRSLKDVKTLKLTPSTAPKSTSATAAEDDKERPQFACPFTMKEMNGLQPFIYINKCGCVMSLAGLKAMTSSPSPPSSAEGEAAQTQLDVCPQCATKFNKDTDVVAINPPEEEQLAMRFAMDKRRLLEPAKPKPKKSTKKRKLDGDADALPENGEAKKKKKSSPPLPSHAPSTNPSIAAASRAVVSSLAEEEARRKAGMSAAVKSLYGDGKSAKKETFMTMGTFTRYA